MLGFGERIQNACRLGSEIDADRTEKRKLAFYLCMLHKCGSTDMATVVHDCGYLHAVGPDMGVLQLWILAGRRAGGWWVGVEH